MRHKFWQAHEYITIVCRNTHTTSSGKMYSRHRDKERRWIRLKEFPCLVREHVICMFSPFLPSQFNAGMFDANKICIKSVSIKSPFHTSSISSSFTRGRMTGLLNHWINAYILIWSLERRFLLFLTPFLISRRLKNDLPCKRLPWRKMLSDW